MDSVVLTMALISTTYSKESEHLVEGSSKRVWGQLENYGKDFVMMMSYFGHMVTKNSCNVQFV